MRIGILRKPRHSHESGILGAARVDRDLRRLLARLRPGDIAIVDRLDLGRSAAAALASRRPAAVVNASPCISGRYPVGGAELLLRAGIAVLDDVGRGVMTAVRDGQWLRLDGETLYGADGEELARGVRHDERSLAALRSAATAGFGAQLEALIAQAGQLLRLQPELFLDGGERSGGESNGPVEAMLDELPLPAGSSEQLGPFPGNRPVLVAAPSGRLPEDLRLIRDFLRRTDAFVVAVDDAAGALRAAGHSVDLIVRPDDSPTGSADLTAEVVVVHRRWSATAEDGGISGGDGGRPRPELVLDLPTRDAALLLAAALGARLIVTAGFPETVLELLDEGDAAAALLGRLKLAGRLVPASAAARLTAVAGRRRHRLMRITAGAAAVVAAFGAGVAAHDWSGRVAVVGRSLLDSFDLLFGR